MGKPTFFAAALLMVDAGCVRARAPDGAPVRAATTRTAAPAPRPVRAATSAAAAARFTAPLQAYASADGQVHLLRPAVAQVSTGAAAVGTLASPGWRLVWDGSAATPGRVVVRLSLPVAPEGAQTRRTEYLQVGLSRETAAVRGCLTAGLKGPSGAHMPDRKIDGRRFSVWSNGDAGMSQQIAATDLRTVVDGACYAVERFSYGDTASPRDGSITLSQAQGAAMMDRALASLQLGAFAADQVARPPAVKTPPGALAR